MRRRGSSCSSGLDAAAPCQGFSWHRMVQYPQVDKCISVERAQAAAFAFGECVTHESSVFCLQCSALALSSDLRVSSWNPTLFGSYLRHTPHHLSHSCFATLPWSSKEGLEYVDDQLLENFIDYPAGIIRHRCFTEFWVECARSQNNDSYSDELLLSQCRHAMQITKAPM